MAKWTLRLTAVVFLLAVLGGPLALIMWRTFQHGLPPVWSALTTHTALSALQLTLVTVLISVPANAVFGIIAALVLTRPRLPGRVALSTLIDLPLALSPVVVGLSLLLVWGRNGWFGGFAQDAGIQVIYSLPGIVMATIVVSLPFVVRELVPVLRQLGTEQQEAAATLGASRWQILWRVVLPALRHGLAYGVVLTTARALGEYGAVAVVSGKIAGRTDTLTLHVEERFQSFDLVGAYAASMLLALLAVSTVLVLRLLNRKAV
ncbi:MAG: sulfate ABC transporter permease subunit [Thermoleophilia bacterium]